jgi:hypothetical protein
MFARACMLDEPLFEACKIEIIGLHAPIRDSRGRPARRNPTLVSTLPNPIARSERS